MITYAGQTYSPSLGFVSVEARTLSDLLEAMGELDQGMTTAFIAVAPSWRLEKLRRIGDIVTVRTEGRQEL
jgi:hypothetical protein